MTNLQKRVLIKLCSAHDCVPESEMEQFIMSMYEWPDGLIGIILTGGISLDALYKAYTDGMIGNKVWNRDV